MIGLFLTGIVLGIAIGAVGAHAGAIVWRDYRKTNPRKP